jgi:hypothetical protein
MIIDKFDPNLILVNINKLKPYRFVEDQTFQPVVAKSSWYTPKLLDRLNYESKCENNKRIRSWDMFPGL